MLGSAAWAFMTLRHNVSQLLLSKVSVGCILPQGRKAEPALFWRLNRISMGPCSMGPSLKEKGSNRKEKLARHRAYALAEPGGYLALSNIFRVRAGVSQATDKPISKSWTKYSAPSELSPKGSLNNNIYK